MRQLPYQQYLTICAIILVMTGLTLRYWIGKRRFKRRTIAGLQQFKSYANAVCTLGWEKVIRWIGILLIVAGCLLYLMR